MAEDLGPMSTLMPHVTTTLENTPYPQYEQKIITQLAAGTAPDIILIDAYWAGDFFALDKFVPLNNYLKSLNYDTNSWYKNWIFDPREEDTYGGQVQAITLIEGAQLGVFINNKLAEKAGMLDEAPVWGKASY